MSNRLRRHTGWWKIPFIFLGALALVSCESLPTPGILVTPRGTLPPKTSMPVPPTSSNPAPSMGNIIPKPVSVTATGGSFVLSARAVIYVAPATDELKAIGQYLAELLNPATGYNLPVREKQGAPAEGSITLSLSGADPALGDEGYRLDITPQQVSLTANGPAGLFYGVQTLRQLLPAAIESPTLQPDQWMIGTGTITDTPRFAWRGTMLDVARHFFSVREVTRYIDLLAAYKINRLHLHLTDDQGWRIQIKSWPNLTAYGGSLEVGGTPGGYYSQDDYAYIVNYARSRYITVVPEIEMPGHITAALASYPDLVCDGTAPEYYTGTGGTMGSLCVGRDITTTFLEDVIRELAALTPGPYLHIGGDEAQGTDKADYIRFINQVLPIVAANGKQAIGWEEIAQAQLRPDTIAQHWNLDPGLAVQAADQGAKIIMSPADKAYLDMKYRPDTVLGQTWAGIIDLRTAYSWDPAALIASIPEKDILGVEAPLWSETLTTLDDVEYMAFPRILGYAEIGWTPQSQRDWYEYATRLAAQGPRLQALGVHFYASPEVPWP